MRNTTLLSEIKEYNDSHKNYPSTSHFMDFDQLMSIIVELKETYNILTIELKDNDNVEVIIKNF